MSDRCPLCRGVVIGTWGRALGARPADGYRECECTPGELGKAVADELAEGFRAALALANNPQEKEGVNSDG